MITLLKVNGVDFTDNVNQKKYSINQVDVGSAWTDANFIQHVDIYRQVISGNIPLTFTDIVLYNTFMNCLNAAKQNGTYTIEVYVQNINEQKRIKCNLTCTTDMRIAMKNFGGNPAVAAVKLNVEEL